MLVALDEPTSEDAKLGLVLHTFFRGRARPFRRGNIVEFRRSFMATDSANLACWAVCSRLVIEAYFADRCSTLFVKGYPLEFEGRLPPDDEPAHLAFRRRRAAMMRHYEKELAVKPIAGALENDGWMVADLRRWRRF